MQSHIRKVYACLAVTCHLHFWQNDRDLLRATVVTRGWNGYRNKSTESRPWRRKFSHRSSRDSNPRPFNHESGALTTELSTPLAKFDEHFVPRVNVLHERALFYSRAQLPDENVETYARKLYEFSEQANVPNREESIRDRLVLGVRDRELSEKLQLQANLTLKDAVRQ